MRYPDPRGCRARAAGGRERFPDVLWKAMAGLRNVIVHQHDELDIEAIHRAATVNAEMLLDQLPGVVADLTRPPG